MSLRDDLIAAKALIDTPEKWCKDTWDREGAFCAVGATRHLNNGYPNNRCYAALRDAMPPELDNHNVIAFNDDPATTHADIMALFDRAIASAQHEGHGETGERT